MICPQCEVEYRAGFTQCADCEIPLVDELAPPSEAGGEGLARGLGDPDSTSLVLLWETASSEDLSGLLDNLEQAEIPYVVLAGTALRGIDGLPVHRGDPPDPWRARVLVSGSRWDEAVAHRPA